MENVTNKFQRNIFL